MPEMIAIVAIVFSNLVFLAIIVAWWRTRQRKLELQAEVQSKLIERFGSTPELVQFLQSEAGRDFVNGVQVGAAGNTRNQARERILTGVRRSVLLSSVGVGFLFLWFIFDQDGFSVPAIILLALGIGHLVATFISLSMSRKMFAEEPLS